MLRTPAAGGIMLLLECGDWLIESEKAQWQTDSVVYCLNCCLEYLAPIEELRKEEDGDHL